MMINNEAIACFTIETCEARKAIFIRRGTLDNETKINGKTLIALRSMTRSFLRSSCFVWFSGQTNRTVLKAISNGKFWNTLDKFMKIGATARVKMCEAMVPKNTQLISS